MSDADVNPWDDEVELPVYPSITPELFRAWRSARRGGLNPVTREGFSLQGG